MTVETIMTQDVFTVRMDDSIGTIRGILKTAGFHHLFVVQNGILMGVISDRDVLRVISPFLNTLMETTRDLSILDRRVHQIMSRNLITIAKDCPIEDAMKLLIEKNISCLPVVANDHKLLGVVTWRDILRAHLNSKSKGNAKP